jgi:HSP20 family protein
MALKDLIPWKRRQNDQTESGMDYPLHRFHWNINRILDDIMGSWSNDSLPGDGFISPRIDLSETKKNLTITADMPGMDEDNIDVSLENNFLVIRGQKKTEKEDQGQHYYHMERSYGSFYRTISLPCEVDESKVKADYKKGVLTIHLPKPKDERRQSRKIEVH